MDVRAIEPGSMYSVRALLSANDLPTEDLDDSVELLGAYEGSQLVGVIGLQRLDELGLLRSLAVDPKARDRGIARLLCERVFATCNLELWLLTTSARDYFTRHGFEVIDRAHVPEPIRATAQFASLCPASAVVMRRST